MQDKKVLVTAGCSHIFGTDLEDCSYPTASKSVWPALIADKEQLELHNVAKAGASCQTVFRRVSIALTQLLTEYNANDILLIVQFPNLSRFESINRCHQWCGEDFPYLTNKWSLDVPNADSSIKKKVDESLKLNVIAKDETQLVVDSLQAMLSLLLLCDSLNIETYWALADNWDYPHLPYAAYLSDNAKGDSSFGKIHKSYVGHKFSTKKDSSSQLEYYLLGQEPSSPVFDSFTSVLYNNIVATNSTQLTFDGTLGWCNWAQENGYHRIKRNNNPKLIGHYNEQAHAKAFLIMHEQILRHRRGKHGTI